MRHLRSGNLLGIGSDAASAWVDALIRNWRTEDADPNVLSEKLIRLVQQHKIGMSAGFFDAVRNALVDVLTSPSLPVQAAQSDSKAGPRGVGSPDEALDAAVVEERTMSLRDKLNSLYLALRAHGRAPEELSSAAFYDWQIAAFKASPIADALPAESRLGIIGNLGHMRVVEAQAQPLPGPRADAATGPGPQTASAAALAGPGPSAQSGAPH